MLAVVIALLLLFIDCPKYQQDILHYQADSADAFACRRTGSGRACDLLNSKESAAVDASAACIPVVHLAGF